MKVEGDPTPGNNGLFFVYTDHLGSTAVMRDETGTAVAGSLARYLPFGGYWGDAPTQNGDGRGYTGQKENMGLGLMYYNARYYLPGIGKFASADTLVPDPTNPQQYNRYAYVLNNPIRYTDPTGHLTEDEIEQYFGYTATESQTLREVMIADGWNDKLTDWLLQEHITFGDAFFYSNNDTNGEAFLVLFEDITGENHRGGFVIASGLYAGQELEKDSLLNLSTLSDYDHNVVSLEEKYKNNFHHFYPNGTQKPVHRGMTQEYALSLLGLTASLAGCIGTTGPFCSIPLAISVYSGIDTLEQHINYYAVIRHSPPSFIGTGRASYGNVGGLGSFRPFNLLI